MGRAEQHWSYEIMKKRKQHWSYWVLLAFFTILTVTSLVFWLLDVPKPPSWLVSTVIVVFVALAWWEAIKRSDSEIEYKNLQMKVEVRSEVERQLRHLKPNTVPKVVDAEVEDEGGDLSPARLERLKTRSLHGPECGCVLCASGWRGR